MTEFAGKLRDAGLSNFHPTTVSRVERGERPAKLGEASVIAQVLGASLDDLVEVPMEPWEILADQLEEYGERAETYARWTAHWGMATEEFTAESLRVADELEQMVKENAVPENKVARSLELISKYRELAPQDRIRFWRDHISALDADERTEFNFRNRGGQSWQA